MTNVLITGAGGQLANSIKGITSDFRSLNFILKSSSELDITNKSEVDLVFKNQNVNYCVNCAAYTAVDNAEDDINSAFLVNEKGVKNIAIACEENNTILIHISTDFVFDGKKSLAYHEEDVTNPKGVYGLSKLKGELAIKDCLTNFFIIRTSWLYSEHNKNFMKTMIELSKSKKELSVVEDQIGTPTYAKDLASVILKIIETQNNKFGIYHYSNEGVASWYDFAYAIFNEIQSDIELKPIKSKEYPTPAKRPHFSILDKTKIKANLKIEIPHWRSSLSEAITNFKNKEH